jgi:hypothetical protein
MSKTDLARHCDEILRIAERHGAQRVRDRILAEAVPL